MTIQSANFITENQIEVNWLFRDYEVKSINKRQFKSIYSTSDDLPIGIPTEISNDLKISSTSPCGQYSVRGWSKSDGSYIQVFSHGQLIHSKDLNHGEICSDSKNIFSFYLKF